jgi:cell division control protein 7
MRIQNELELLHDLHGCNSVCPLITAFRHHDQVVAILPYFHHEDFRLYYRHMTIPQMRHYFRALFSALAAVHKHNILHRDIKPTNFLYNPATRHGVLVDFGLAEREGTDSTPCACRNPAYRQSNIYSSNTIPAPSHGYPKNDPRPSRRANRAGTRGFRAPEVLLKCTSQTPKIDIWSAGVILLTLLAKRFPFFNSADDIDATIEMASIFGTRRMRQAAALHSLIWECNVPTIGNSGYPFEGLIHWSCCREPEEKPPKGEKMAIEFMRGCLEVIPSERFSAKEALRHEWLMNFEESDGDEEEKGEGEEEYKDEGDQGEEQGQEDVDEDMDREEIPEEDEVHML